MFNIGFSEALLIFLVALVVLGPERLPEVGRFLAKITLEFKKAVDELKKELEIEEVERDIKEAKDELEQLVKETKEGLDNPLKLLEEFKEENKKSAEGHPKEPNKDLPQQ